MFITFEGGEGSGKSTLLSKIAKKLQADGREVVITNEPGGSALGKYLRKTLLHDDDISISKKAELLLYLADRAQHIEEVIKPALEAGKIVLCDRFNDSTVAYQGGARGLGIDETQELCDLVCQGMTPDLTFLLDLDPRQAFKRLKEENFDRIEKETMDFHERVRQAFHALVHRDPERILLIDANRSPEAVFQDALDHLQTKL